MPSSENRVCNNFKPVAISIAENPSYSIKQSCFVLPSGDCIDIKNSSSRRRKSIGSGSLGFRVVLGSDCQIRTPIWGQSDAAPPDRGIWQSPWNWSGGPREIPETLGGSYMLARDRHTSLRHDEKMQSGCRRMQLRMSAYPPIKMEQ